MIVGGVKSGTGYMTISLDRFKRKFASYVAQSVVVHPGDVFASENVVHLPLYMAGLLGEKGIGR